MTDRPTSPGEQIINLAVNEFADAATADSRARESEERAEKEQADAERYRANRDLHLAVMAELGVDLRAVVAEVRSRYRLEDRPNPLDRRRYLLADGVRAISEQHIDALLVHLEVEEFRSETDR